MKVRRELVRVPQAATIRLTGYSATELIEVGGFDNLNLEFGWLGG